MESVQAIAEALGLRLHRSVAIDDLQRRLLAHTAHTEPVDSYRIESIMRRRANPEPSVTQFAMQFGIATAPGPVHIPGSSELDSLPRICVPIRCQNVLLGYLWLMDCDPDLTEDELDLAARSADAAGEVLFREQLLSDLRLGHERELLRDLLNAERDVRRHAVDRLVSDGHVPANSGATAVIIAAESAGGEGHTVAFDLALQRAQRRLAPLGALAMTTGSSGGVLLIADPKPPGRDELAECGAALRADFQREAVSGETVHVGIGPTVHSLEEAHESHSCAAEAIRVSEAVPDMGAVTFWSDLGVYRLLVQLPLEKLRTDAMPVGLRRLIDQDSSRVLLQTLEVYLDVACNAAIAVERLSIHRTSLYYRLGRIEEITEMSLRSGSDRLSLHLGIKLARLIGLLAVDQPV